MEARIYSPSVKVLPEGNKILPVFGDRDQVGGFIILDPACQSGRLMLSVRSSGREATLC